LYHEKQKETVSLVEASEGKKGGQISGGTTEMKRLETQVQRSYAETARGDQGLFDALGLEVFRDTEKRKKELEEELGELDRIVDNRKLTVEEIIKRDECSHNLERTFFHEEVSWRQKSKALWLKEGNRNTRYFHKVANSHRRNNTVAGMMVDGNRTKDPAVITNHILHFYKTLYSEQYQVRSTRLFAPMMENVSSIDEGERVWMEREFAEEDVWDVVRKMKGDKARGPNGFSMAFFSEMLGGD
jgi:hypothetical protein